jgi:hypothetical protein
MLYSAHFDASGTEKDHPAITVAGCISTVDRWGKFERRWNKTLVDDGLPQGTVFHMTDFVTCNKPFDIYKGKSAKKAALFSKLVTCVAKHVSGTFSTSVVIKEYEDFNRDWLARERFGFPYSFAGLMCVQRSISWLMQSKAARKHHLKVFFEKGDDHQDELEGLCFKEYGFKPLFIPKSEMVQFQPGDLVAWKNRTAIVNAITHGEKGDPQMLESILRSIRELKRLPGFSGVYDKDALQKASQDGVFIRRPVGGIGVK